ncbi:hypothetical protein E2562_012234 [Oryza meyeriana var. granulata]|uniref:Uncharacterized protein n=1 Tax=Oryza meyeriana var. granulata TaxID=110450 RepID=A0A6G1D2M6_9ORYZ|nr:hypothetical protein E2562_012234 [Oryza meyeriana var. granulata]
MAPWRRNPRCRGRASTNGLSLWGDGLGRWWFAAAAGLSRAQGPSTVVRRQGDFPRRQWLSGLGQHREAVEGEGEGAAGRPLTGRQPGSGTPCDETRRTTGGEVRVADRPGAVRGYGVVVERVRFVLMVRPGVVAAASAASSQGRPPELEDCRRLHGSGVKRLLRVAIVLGSVTCGFGRRLRAHPLLP